MILNADHESIFETRLGEIRVQTWNTLKRHILGIETKENFANENLNIRLTLLASES